MDEPNRKGKLKPINNEQMMAAYKRFQELQKSMIAKSTDFGKSRSQVKPRMRESDLKRSKPEVRTEKVKKKKKKSVKKKGQVVDQVQPRPKPKAAKSGRKDRTTGEQPTQRSKNGENRSRVKRSRLSRSKTIDDPTSLAKIYKELEMKAHPLYATLTDAPVAKSQADPKKPKYHKFVKKSKKKNGKSGLSKSVNKIEDLRIETKVKSETGEQKELRMSRKAPQTPKIRTPKSGAPRKALKEAVAKTEDKPQKSKSTRPVTGRKSASKRRKISKIGALFVREFLPLVELDKILQSWALLEHARKRLAQPGRLEVAVNTYFLRLFEKKGSYLVSLFSDFNNIGGEVRETLVLEFWTYITLFYFLHEEGEVESLSQGPLEVIFTVLLRSVFYMGLILNKAKRARILDIKTPCLRRFNDRMKELGFPSGVPLIRTLREGNKTIRQKLKKVLFYTSRRIRKQYQWTLDNLQKRFEKLVTESSNAICSELKNKHKNEFFFAEASSVLGPGSGKLSKFSFSANEKIDDFDFDFLKSSATKSKDPIFKMLRKKVTANEFISCALDPTRNGDSKLKNPRLVAKAEKEPRSPKKPKKPKVSVRSKKTREKSKSATANAKDTGKGLSRVSASSKDKEQEKAKNKQFLKTSSFKIKAKKEKEGGMQKSLVSIQTKTDLSEFSNKYQPLINVSELRQSALSMSRQNKAKSKRSTGQKSDQKNKLNFKITRFK